MSSRTNRKSRRSVMSTSTVMKEVRYISRQAVAGISKTVSLWPLFFFSTSDGDAWMLDIEDGLAVCLVLRGENQPYDIRDAGHRFQIDWEVNYRFENESFVLFDASGEELVIDGYPVRHIVNEIEHARRAQQHSGSNTGR